jgi:uncharacterized protein YjdB
MKRVLFTFFSLLCLSYTSGQVSLFSFPDQEARKPESVQPIRQNPKSGFERSMTKFPEAHPMYPGESLAEAVARSQTQSLSAEENTDYTAKFSTNLSWGTVYALDASGSDPKQLFYTKELELNPNYPANYYYYAGAMFTFYNENFVQVHQIHVEAPKLSDETVAQCNIIAVVGEYSKSLYNTDAQLEFMFMTHWFDPDAQGKTGPETQIYSYSIYQSNGTTSSLYYALDRTESVYQYAGSGNSTRKLIVNEYKYDADTVVIKVYAARNLKAGTGLLKTHKIATDRLVAFNAPLLMVETINGAPRYFMPSYEQKYWATKSPSWTVTPDNKLVLDFYDLSVASATTNNLYKSLTMPIQSFDADMATTVEMAVTFPNYEVTTQVFNNTDDIEVLYGVQDNCGTCENNPKRFYLVNEAGELQKSLTNVRLVEQLADLPGYDRQYAVIGENADNVTEISFFNIAKWEIVQKFGSVYKGEQLTSNFDRLLTENGPAYVFEMYDPFKEGEDVYSKVNWYDAASGDLIKTAKFNMGPKGIYFVPALTPTTLNPYFINTDDKMEYVGAARISNASGSNSYTSFRIYNEDGELLFQSDANQAGQAFSGGMGAYNTGGVSQYLIVAYTANVTGRVYDFIPLPLTSFAGGGDGTPANPYIISSAGDFDAVRLNPAASYLFGNDIDMLPLLSTKYATTGWNPFNLSAGAKIDGAGYQMKNLKLRDMTAPYVSLFEQMNAKSVIENLFIPNAEILTNANNSSGISFIANQMSDSASIRNVHITGNIGEGTGIASNTAIGGFAATMSGGSSILQSSFDGNIIIQSANGGTKGGLVGTLQSGAFVEKSYMKGTVSAKNASGGTVGGIAGTMSTGRPKVQNCYSTADINIQYTQQNLGVGGIAGSLGQNGTAKGLVENCYATGRIVSVSSHTSDNIFAGGIVGTTTFNTNGNTTLNMSGLVALNDSITAKKAGRISGLNTSYDTKDIIQNCYALSDIKIGTAGAEAAITSIRADSIHGADITVQDLTEAFYTGIGWVFGTDAASPWVWNENGQPRLWYEYLVKGVALNYTTTLIDVQETVQLIATVIPLDAFNQDVTWTSSDPAIATVDETGLVTGLKFGEATITATTVEGGFIAACEVKVGVAESITLNKTELTLIEEDEETLTAVILPESATYTEITWSSSNDEIATVDATGKVTAIAEGECSIYVSLNNSNLADTCSVTVETKSGIRLPDAAVTVVSAKNRIEISSSNGLENITVYDLSGQSVYVSQEKAYRLTIPTSNWNKGVYVVKIGTNRGISYQKLTVL